MKDSIFRFENVRVDFRQGAGLWREGRTVRVFDNFDMELPRGQVTALVGESGSGKSTLAALMSGLIRPSFGTILYDGRDIEDWAVRDRQAFSRRVQIIFQNPFLSLDPRWSVKRLVAEGIRSRPSRQRHDAVRRSLIDVGLPETFLERPPERLSGGERQRVALARALVVEPEFLVLDEPTSSLDVSVQADILDLLRSLRPRFSGGMLFITHDLSLIGGLADAMMVLNRGRIVERGPCAEVLAQPCEEYTRRLLEAVPPWPPASKEGNKGR